MQEISKIKSDKENLDAALSKITELINNSKNPLIITDYLIKRFRLQNEIREFINKFNIKITSMIMGKGVINEDDPHYIGINHGKISDEELEFITGYKTIEQAKEQSGCEKFEDAYLKFSDEEADA